MGILEYACTVIRVWEERRQPIIAAGLVGLYPLLPLMKGEIKDETPEQALKESISVVQEIQDEALQLDLLAAMAILAGGKYSSDMVLSMIRGEMVMESPIFQEWVKDAETSARIAGIAEGEAKGKAEMTQEAICKYLEVRFDTASLVLQQRVRSMNHCNYFHHLLVTCNTIYDAVVLKKYFSQLLVCNFRNFPTHKGKVFELFTRPYNSFCKMACINLGIDCYIIENVF